MKDSNLYVGSWINLSIDNNVLQREYSILFCSDKVIADVTHQPSIGLLRLTATVTVIMSGIGSLSHLTDKRSCAIHGEVEVEVIDLHQSNPRKG
jgi:hypothetical protein